MPTYDFVCDNCGRVDEVQCPMAEIADKTVRCPACSRTDGAYQKPDGEWVISKSHLPMRRIYGLGGVVFKGKDWPGQDIKRKGQNKDIQEQRRKACVLKDQGVVPQEHRIDLGSEAKDRYAAKFADKDLDKLYRKSVTNPTPTKEDK
jgi:putative FmdB family regulatory protein